MYYLRGILEVEQSNAIFLYKDFAELKENPPHHTKCLGYKKRALKAFKNWQ
jgi:hypothetical protein